MSVSLFCHSTDFCRTRLEYVIEGSGSVKAGCVGYVGGSEGCVGQCPHPIKLRTSISSISQSIPRTGGGSVLGVDDPSFCAQSGATRKAFGFDCCFDTFNLL